MDKIIVSVVMSACNEKEHIEKAIESIVNQNFQQWELIFVNEFGSDDGTFKIASKWKRKDARIKLIQNKERLGLPASLNVGIKYAKGKYIARMDADDYSLPERLKLQYEYMERNPDIDIIGSNYYKEIDGIIIGESSLPEEDDEIKGQLLFKNVFCHPSVCMRKTSLEKHCLYYDESKMVAEDYDLWLRALPKIKFANLPEKLVIWKQESNDLRREELHEKGIEVIAGCYKKLFHEKLGIEPDQYNDWVFGHGMSGLNSRTRTNGITDNLCQIYELYLELEKSNGEIGLVNSDVLRRVIKKQWNKTLLRMHVPKSIGTRFDCWIPELDENTDISVDEEFRGKLHKKLIDIEPIQFICEQSIKVGKIVPDNARIVLWGVGRRYHQFVNWISGKGARNSIQLVGITDQNDKGIELLETELPKFHADEIINQNYDYIVITPDGRFDEIKDMLQNRYGVNLEKILPLSCLYKKIEDKESIR